MYSREACNKQINISKNGLLNSYKYLVWQRYTNRGLNMTGILTFNYLSSVTVDVTVNKVLSFNKLSPD